MDADAPPKTEHAYPMSYQLRTNNPPLTPEQAKAATEEGWGSCDAMLTASILFPEDGSYSVFFDSKDGRTGQELTDHEWFKVWSMLTHRLAQSKTLDAGRKGFAASVFDVIRGAVISARGN